MLIRHVILAISLVFCALPLKAEGLKPVMEAVRADEWAKATALAREIGPVAADIVTWRRLRAGEGRFGDYQAFLLRRADWPGLDRVRLKGEAVLPEGGQPGAVLRFFDGVEPKTGSGALRLIQAYRALKREGDAQAQAVLTWRTLPLTEPGQSWLLKHYAQHLAPHHSDRLDAMLWRGAQQSARQMFPLVPEGWQALAEARMALRDQRAGVDTLIAKVPQALAHDGGLAWERFNWRVRKGRAEDAIALLDERSIGRESLGRPDRWANWRRIFARRLLREGKAEQAYRLAANHFLTEGSAYADLEWLSGFVALEFLDEPQLALSHFDRFRAAIFTPISLGRAGYWQGRALTALDRPQEAQAAYARAARHQTSFYGQLAAEVAGIAADPALIGNEAPPDWRPLFPDNSLIRAATLFHDAGERNLAEWFLTHLAEGADAPGQAALAGLALNWGEHHIALRIAKIAARSENILMQAYFPVTALARSDHPVPSELVMAIARRESEFDPAVTSPAGARGLMQLMPGTARDVSRDLELTYSAERLLTDPAYNATLGAAYLKGLVDEFGANPILVSVGYNAGPGRSRKWIQDRGDPRYKGTDPVIWIELIPFRETRNYVMRVSESLAVYRARLSGQTAPLSLTQELQAR